MNYKELKEALETVQKKISHTKAEFKLLKKKLKDEYEVNSIQEAEDLLNTLHNEVELAIEKRDNLIEKINKLLENLNESD